MNKMYRLYHYTLDPSSRAVRIILAEKSIPFTAVLEQYWEKREVFVKINKSGSVPFLAKKATQEEQDSGIGNLLLFGINAIIEYLEEKHDSIQFIFGTPEQKAEIRKVLSWMTSKFADEVMNYILHEKIISFLKNKEFPDTNILNIASRNLNAHLDYLNHIIGTQGWLGCRRFSVADIVASANISVLDYLGMIQWDKSNVQNLKEWYSLIKSRPSFRSILQDHVPGFSPPAYYRELDF